MNDDDLLDLLDFCADHISHFGAWPSGFETSAGVIWDVDDYLQHIEERMPSLARFMSRAKEN